MMRTSLPLLLVTLLFATFRTASATSATCSRYETVSPDCFNACVIDALVECRRDGAVVTPTSKIGIDPAQFSDLLEAVKKYPHLRSADPLITPQYLQSLDREKITVELQSPKVLVSQTVLDHTGFRFGRLTVLFDESQPVAKINRAPDETLAARLIPGRRVYLEERDFKAMQFPSEVSLRIAVPARTNTGLAISLGLQRINLKETTIEVEMKFTQHLLNAMKGRFGEAFFQREGWRYPIVFDLPGFPIEKLPRIAYQRTISVPNTQLSREIESVLVALEREVKNDLISTWNAHWDLSQFPEAIGIYRIRWQQAQSEVTYDPEINSYLVGELRNLLAIDESKIEGPEAWDGITGAPTPYVRIHLVEQSPYFRFKQGYLFLHPWDPANYVPKQSLSVLDPLNERFVQIREAQIIHHELGLVAEGDLVFNSNLRDFFDDHSLRLHYLNGKPNHEKQVFYRQPRCNDNIFYCEWTAGLHFEISSKKQFCSDLDIRCSKRTRKNRSHPLLQADPFYDLRNDDVPTVLTVLPLNHYRTAPARRSGQWAVSFEKLSSIARGEFSPQAEGTR